MDTLIVDKKKYHKSCFYCEHCRNKLGLGNYVSLHGHFYCLHHYKQLLKSKGSYDNELGHKSPTGSAGLRPTVVTHPLIAPLDVHKISLLSLTVRQ
uniref:LIM zinc-binding domain-containing protein n=1 Tax=Mola mola TaxID=94237 RepID=A0A3Q3VZD5_MOLML